MEKFSTSDFVSKESSEPKRSEKDIDFDLYVGLARYVHKASIAVAVAELLMRFG